MNTGIYVKREDGDWDLVAIVFSRKQQGRYCETLGEDVQAFVELELDRRGDARQSIQRPDLNFPEVFCTNQEHQHGLDVKTDQQETKPAVPAERETQ